MAAVFDKDVERAPLGALLVSRGFLSEEQLEWALAEQGREARPLGEILVEEGVVRAPVIAQALATQSGGLLRTEYGFATGFDTRLPATPSREPPVSVPAACSGPALRIMAEPAAEQLRAPLSPEPDAVGSNNAPAQLMRHEMLELELAGVVEENERLRSRLGKLQLQAAALQSECGPLRLEAAVVGARVAGLEAATSSLQAEREQLRSRVVELERQLVSETSG